MSDWRSENDDPATKGALARKLERGGLVFAAGAAILAVIGAALSGGGLERLMLAYTANFAFVLSIALGALFFVLVTHLTQAGWSVTVRRSAETLIALFPWTALLFLPILAAVLFGEGLVYPWTDPHAHLGSKTAYLNGPFFAVRWIVYFAFWIAVAAWYRSHSLAQDTDGDPAHTQKMQRAAAPLLVAYAFTVTFASFDLLMSLDPHWFSTIFGVYYFAGCALAGFAALIVIQATLQYHGLVTTAVTAEHYHGLGKFLFGFVFFWGYIAFSQYLLIWYANLPEEVGWMLRRGVSTGHPNAWSGVILFLLFGHFVVPFLGLLSRHVKRRRVPLCGWAVWLLAMHWLDLIWLTMPELTTDALAIGLTEVATGVALTGLIVAVAARVGHASPLVAAQDPRLGEALAMENP